jgi:tetratricopeptide (TPR) repeat protein
LAQLEAIHKSLLQKKKKDIAEAVDIDRRQALAWVKRAEGKDEEALKLLRAIADKDEGASGASDGIPAREMLADMLLELKRPAEALAECDTELKANPNRFNALYGAAQAAELAGKAEKANAYYSTLIEICTGSSSDRPELKRARSLLAKK